MVSFFNYPRICAEFKHVFFYLGLWNTSLIFKHEMLYEKEFMTVYVMFFFFENNCLHCPQNPLKVAICVCNEILVAPLSIVFIQSNHA